MLMFRKAIEVAGEIGTQKLGIARSALVCKIWNGDECFFRRCHDRQIRELIHMTETHQLAEDRLTQDVVLWRKSTTEFNDFFLHQRYGSRSVCTDRSQHGVKWFGSHLECHVLRL